MRGNNRRVILLVGWGLLGLSACALPVSALQRHQHTIDACPLAELAGDPKGPASLSFHYRYPAGFVGAPAPRKVWCSPQLLLSMSAPILPALKTVSFSKAQFERLTRVEKPTILIKDLPQLDLQAQGSASAQWGYTFSGQGKRCDESLGSMRQSGTKALISPKATSIPKTRAPTAKRIRGSNKVQLWGLVVSSDRRALFRVKIFGAPQ